MAQAGRIHVGIGGWTFEPWRKTFYPPGLPHARELEYAASKVTAIEINATYYRLQKAESFKRWADAAPPGFAFSVKASRYCTNRRVLAEAGEAVERFVGQGLTELGDSLGPLLWQFMPTKAFDPDDFAAFLALLPASQDGIKLRHALEVRHESFRDPAFVALARKAGAAIVYADSDDYPALTDITADFVYARLQRTREDEPEGYDRAELDRWADAARIWSEGGTPDGLAPMVGPPPLKEPRDLFLFMISGAKVRAPAAAQAVLARL